MAQAFSSFDTYLAPFVKVDNLSYKEVKQCIQSFVFGVNTPSRWGCVDKDTEVLSVNGFKKYNELKEDEFIYTWNMDTGKLELNPVRKVVVKPFNGKLHSYKSRGYNQTVTPDHRMLIKKHNADEYKIEHSENIFSVKTPFSLPVSFKSVELKRSQLSDEEIRLAAAIYTDGAFDFRDGKIHKITIYKSPKRYGNEMIENDCKVLGIEFNKLDGSGEFGAVNRYVFYGDNARRLYELTGGKKKIDSKFFEMNREQSELFLTTWSKFDGNSSRYRLQYDNDEIASQLQHIALRAGKCSYLYKDSKSQYVKIRNVDNVSPKTREEVDYNDIVWCPNVENGTAVFRKDGCVYISGQCQAPFSNITLDWTVPPDLAELNAIVGGKEMNFRYKDCQKEMDMVNKAFLEVMIEGDANGRGFQYPIPTYSITRDFDWSETENNKLLFEMTAKYGIPYFSNYINSDMEPSDVRSMCPLTPDTLVTVKSEQNGIRVAPIKDIYRTFKNHNTDYLVWTGKEWCKGHPVQTPKTDVYEIKFSNGYSVRMGKDHLQPTRDFGTLSAENLKVDMWLPFNKNQYGSDIGSFDLGYAIGAYAGDGSHDDSSIVYSLCSFAKDNETEKKLTDFWKSIGFSVKVIHTKKNVRFLRVNGNPFDLIKTYIGGKTATDKYLKNKVFNSSIEFKNGFISGYLATDGNRDKRRISTSSQQMKEHLNILLSSMGEKCTQTITDNRENRLGKNTNYTVALPKLARYRDYFDEDENYFYYRIVSINKVDYEGDYLYCFEIDNDDHLFALSNGLITHNCRLRLDLRELRKKSGGFFGSGESTGSVGVVTINMPRIAYLSKDEEDFYKRLDRMMDISARSLKTKRTVIEKLLEAGLYPYTKRYLGTFNNHFSTIGLVGMNEACLNASWLRKDLTNVEAQEFTKNVLFHMRERLSDYQEEYGDLYNLEATPAESTSYRLAKHDVEKYPDIITASMASGVPYYTNSSHLPVGYTDDIFSALDIQDELQTLYTSGTVFHAFLGEKLPSWQSAANLVRKIAENYKLPYFTMSPTYSVCKDHGYLTGEQYKCPYCGKPTEVYSRITGYYRPVQNWNDGKAQEFKDRKTYDVKYSMTKREIEQPFIDAQPRITEAIYAAIEDELKDKYILVATPTCPNCKIVASLMDKNGIPYTKIFATENKEYCEEHGVKQAPTLLVGDKKYVGVSEIKKFLNI